MVSGCQWRLPRARLRLLPSRIRPGLGALAENSHCRGRAPAQRPGGPTHGAGRPAPSQPGSVGHAGGPSQLSPTRSLSPSHRLWPPGLAQWPGPGTALAPRRRANQLSDLASPVLEGGPAAAALPGAPGSGLRTHCSSVREPRRRR